MFWNALHTFQIHNSRSNLNISLIKAFYSYWTNPYERKLLKWYENLFLVAVRATARNKRIAMKESRSEFPSGGNVHGQYCNVKYWELWKWLVLMPPPCVRLPLSFVWTLYSPKYREKGKEACCKTINTEEDRDQRNKADCVNVFFTHIKLSPRLFEKHIWPFSTTHLISWIKLKY